MRNVSATFALGLLLSGLATGTVLAATSTASFSVTATVADTCRVGYTTLTVGASPATLTDKASRLSVQCVLNTPYNVSLRKGQASMTSPIVAGSAPPILVDTRLQAAARPLNRGRLPGSELASTSGIGPSQKLIVNGKNLGVETDASGDYAESVLITVTY